MKKKKAEKKYSASHFESMIKNTKTLPQYMKDIYLDKLAGGSYSDYWVRRVLQIIHQLDKYVK